MIVIGHRGARGLAPENTLASFAAALQAGADEIELDVRVTKDGHCVLNHDPYLHDDNGEEIDDSTIAASRLDDLRGARGDLCTLTEALDAIGAKVPVTIEVKPGVAVTPVAQAIQGALQQEWKTSDLRVASFSQKALRDLHKELPQIETVVNERFGSLRAIWRAKQVKATRLAFNHHNVWWFFIRSMNKKGWRITVYTLNDPAKAKRWERYGLYGIVTDYPERFKGK